MESEPGAEYDADSNRLLQFIWHGLQISIETKLSGGRGLTEAEALAILEPLEPPASDDLRDLPSGGSKI